MTVNSSCPLHSGPCTVQLRACRGHSETSRMRRGDSTGLVEPADQIVPIGLPESAHGGPTGLIRGHSRHQGPRDSPHRMPYGDQSKLIPVTLLHAHTRRSTVTESARESVPCGEAPRSLDNAFSCGIDSADRRWYPTSARADGDRPSGIGSAESRRRRSLSWTGTSRRGSRTAVDCGRRLAYEASPRPSDPRWLRRVVTRSWPAYFLASGLAVAASQRSAAARRAGRVGHRQPAARHELRHHPRSRGERVVEEAPSRSRRPGEVAVAGQSDGAVTAFAAAYEQPGSTTADPRRARPLRRDPRPEPLRRARRRPAPRRAGARRHDQPAGVHAPAVPHRRSPEVPSLLRGAGTVAVQRPGPHLASVEHVTVAFLHHYLGAARSARRGGRAQGFPAPS